MQPADPAGSAGRADLGVRVTWLPARLAGRAEAGDLAVPEELEEAASEVPEAEDLVEAVDEDSAAGAADNFAVDRVAHPAETAGSLRGEAGSRGKRSIVCVLASTINIRIPR